MDIAGARAPVAGRSRRAGALRTLRAATRGELLAPGASAYDTARRGYNGAIDRRPAAILRCAGVSDVAAGIRFARAHRWPLAVRGGGHSLAGFGMCDDGLALDLSRMNALYVDPERRIACAGPGVTWGEIDRATHDVDLIVPGARISTTGVAGVTLGGGYGWLMRRDGLTIDNLVSAEVITADGAQLTASATENDDLFWGLRGGGGNFGVVTSFAYRLSPIGPVVMGGAAFYAADDLRDLLRFYRGLMRDAPDALTAQCNFLIAPDAPFVPPPLRGVPVGAIAVCHTGRLDEAERDLRSLREFKQPLLDRIRPMPYPTVQRLFDAAGTFGHQVHGRSGHLAALDDAVIDAIVAFAPRVTSPLSIVMISPLGGAVARVSDEATAFAHRGAAFDLAVSAVWDEPSDRARHIAWVEEFWRAVAPHTRGVYVNELGDEGRARVAEAYPLATYARLVALKNRYDPQNLFRLNQNIIPTTT
jgi:FAD/FMN-containing dehydrogenase